MEKECLLEINIYRGRIYDYDFRKNHKMTTFEEECFFSISAPALFAHQIGAFTPRHTLGLIGELLIFHRKRTVLTPPINSAIKCIEIQFIHGNKRYITVKHKKGLFANDNSVEEGVRQTIICWLEYVLNNSKFEHRLGIWRVLGMTMELYLDNFNTVYTDHVFSRFDIDKWSTDNAILSRE
jgi:hypothetical protein